MYCIDLTITEELSEYSAICHNLMQRYCGQSITADDMVTKFYLDGLCNHIRTILAELEQKIQAALQIPGNEAKVSELMEYRFKFQFVLERLGDESQAI